MKEHYITEKHQKCLVTLSQQIIEKDKSSSKLDLDREQIIQHLHEFYQNLSISAENIETLNDKLVQISIESLPLNNYLPKLSDDLNDIETAMLLQKAHIDGTIINQNVLSQDILSIKQQAEYEYQTIKQHMPNGTMIWKISNVHEKIYDAQSERQTSIYSPAFYTSTSGYKLCIRLYLNGDGTARGTHISIFLVILRGSYDALLHWPFSYRVSFCLFDQRTMIESGGTKSGIHIIDSFRPDTRSVSFQRPCSLMNIASGIPKFFSLVDFNQPAEINRYIFNDTMFIKIFIDFIGIPKSMLSFVFNLNIGLPRSVQEKLIDEEMKRRQGKNID